MKNCFLLIYCLIASTALKSQDLVLHFDFNSDIITTDSKSILTEYAKDLNYCDSILLIGHTDTVGNKNYNDKLSYKRAKSIQNWMEENSIITKIITESKGELAVLDSNNDSLNRRVELFAFYHFKDFPEKEKQEFYIDNSKDTTLYGNEGTMIKIPANSIRPKSSTNKFRLILSEYYSNPDVVFNNMSTRTDSEILETGGMINLEIFNKDQKCTLKENVQVGFPVQAARNDKMDIFHGVESKEEGVIWRQNSNVNEPFITYESYIVLAEDMPQFNGGAIDEFKSYIQRHIKYPLIAIDSGYCGRVIVTFTVDTDGRIRNAKVVRGAYASLNAEALRIISQSNKWTPGNTGGKNVPVQLTVPVDFILDDDCVFVVDTINRGGEFYSSVNDTNFNKSSVEQINYYIFNTLSLGLINCDWYVFRNKPKTNQKVIVNGLGSISAHIIFSDYNVVLSGVKFDDGFIFSGVPAKENINILVIKRIGEKVFYAVEKTTVSSHAVKITDFSEITFEDLKEKLN